MLSCFFIIAQVSGNCKEVGGGLLGAGGTPRQQPWAAEVWTLTRPKRLTPLPRRARRPPPAHTAAPVETVIESDIRGGACRSVAHNLSFQNSYAKLQKPLNKSPAVTSTKASKIKDVRKKHTPLKQHINDRVNAADGK